MPDPTRRPRPCGETEPAGAAMPHAWRAPAIPAYRQDRSIALRCMAGMDRTIQPIQKVRSTAPGGWCRCTSVAPFPASADDDPAHRLARQANRCPERAEGRQPSPSSIRRNQPGDLPPAPDHGDLGARRDLVEEDLEPLARLGDTHRLHRRILLYKPIVHAAGPATAPPPGVPAWSASVMRLVTTPGRRTEMVKVVRYRHSRTSASSPIFVYTESCSNGTRGRPR